MKTRRQGFLLIAGALISAFFLTCFVATRAAAQDNPLQEAGSPATDTENDVPSVATASGGGVIGPDYVLGPEDVLTVSVFNVPELKQTVRIENDGMISLRLGRVKAAGLTTKQLQKTLEAEWGETYLEHPQVTIFVQQFHAQPVSVIGAVEKPGIYQLPGSRSLIEVLSMAGGLVKRPNGAAGRTVYVTRKGSFEESPMVDGMRQITANQIQIDLKKLLYSRDVGLNIAIKPFDIVSVTKAGIVYVAGEVKKPGGFLLDDRDTFTVLEALALAEGPTSNASKKSARIIHRSDDGSFSETRVDVGKILNGKGEDVVLAANDVLFLPNSRTKYVGKRSAESVVGTLSGLIIFRGL